MVAMCALVTGAFAFTVRQLDNRYVAKKDFDPVAIETEINDALHSACAARLNYEENLWWTFYSQQTFTGLDGLAHYNAFQTPIESSIGSLKAEIERTRGEAASIDAKWKDFCTKHQKLYEEIFHLHPLPPLMVQNRAVWVGDDPHPSLYPVPTRWYFQPTQPHH
jgi:hypothetical protein